MKEKQTYQHPINRYGNKISEEEVVVFDDVRGLPTDEIPFMSPDYVRRIGHFAG